MTTINPGLRMVRRGSHSIQIGLGPGGVILEGLAESDVAFVAALGQGIADAEVFVRAAALGVERARAAEICAKLSGAAFQRRRAEHPGFSRRTAPARTLGPSGFVPGPVPGLHGPAGACRGPCGGAGPHRRGTGSGAGQRRGGDPAARG